jgi:hypothetical protein
VNFIDLSPLVRFFPEDSLMFLKLNQYAFNINLVFFGLWRVLTGYLIFRSTFLPRILGVLLAIDGLGWVMYLYPPLAYHLFIPYIAAASALGEIPLELWLIVMGVNAQLGMDPKPHLPSSHCKPLRASSPANFTCPTCHFMTRHSGAAQVPHFPLK